MGQGERSASHPQNYCRETLSIPSIESILPVWPNIVILRQVIMNCRIGGGGGFNYIFFPISLI